MNFFECEMPVFVCRKSLVGFLRIYEDIGKYFSLIFFADLLVCIFK